MRPVSVSVGVRCRGYSLRLQRAMCDFGADDAFEPAAQKVKAHSGMEVPVSQVAQPVGEPASYWIDVDHLSDYLAAASEVLAADERVAWLQPQQYRFKLPRADEALAQWRDLNPDQPSEAKDDPVQWGQQYASNHRPYLDYRGALPAGLPIGSGAMESGHRWIIQARLKLRGAWWNPDNADQMLALRTERAHGHWRAYWDEQRQAAA